ncbi:multidrug efflux pump subunit AcrA (membrane-fusion protein) [Marmoricola sp. OAE513]|uniref:efflux RND transporter periplasmic adaptor subunit n=1 Tax=Marmoricola sp. OAE513 TaxID=2817894 RepID=UPI001AE77C2F
MGTREKQGFGARLRAVRRRWWAALAALVLVLAGAGTWFMTAGASEDDNTTTITSTVAKGTYKTTVSATGTITPKRDEDVAFTSSGTVTSVQVEVGDKVVKGDVLAKIDDDALIAQREAAESQVTAAQTQLDEDSGSSSTQVAADEASLASARSQLADAEDAVENATLRAPFSGTVSAVGYEVGDQVGGSGGGADPSGSDTTAAITVISPKKLLIDANVSSSDVTRLKKGLQAEITPTGGNETAYGVVTEVGVIATASDTGAAQFPVTVEVTGETTGLYPGASATVEITVKQATDIIAVPTAAVRTDDAGKAYVYVVKSGKRTKTTVALGEVYGAQTEVTSGIKEGDVIEVISITGRRGTGSGGGNRNGGGEFPGGGNFQLPAGGAPGGGPVVIQGNPG